jgi:hypothetical protein
MRGSTRRADRCKKSWHGARRGGGDWERLDFDLRELQNKLDVGITDVAEAKRAQQTLKKAGLQFRAALGKRVRSGQIDAGTAGLLSKWGGAIDALISNFDLDAEAQRKLIDKLLSTVGSSLTDEGEKVFRRELRDAIADRIMTLEPARRSSALDSMIATQPENASRGHLFGEFRMRLMPTPEEIPAPAPLFMAKGAKPKAFSGPDLIRTRTPDDVITVGSGGEIPEGTYLGEDKAGPGAFDMEQLEDLAKRWDEEAGGFKYAPTDPTIAYKGEIYFFSARADAEAALEDMITHTQIGKLMNRKPPAVYVMFLEKDTGVMTLLPSGVSP